MAGPGPRVGLASRDIGGRRDDRASATEGPCPAKASEQWPEGSSLQPEDHGLLLWNPRRVHPVTCRKGCERPRWCTAPGKCGGTDDRASGPACHGLRSVGHAKAFGILNPSTVDRRL